MYFFLLLYIIKWLEEEVLVALNIEEDLVVLDYLEKHVKRQRNHAERLKEASVQNPIAVLE